jgi:hypothetical protein
MHADWYENPSFEFCHKYIDDFLRVVRSIRLSIFNFQSIFKKSSESKAKFFVSHNKHSISEKYAILFHFQVNRRLKAEIDFVVLSSSLDFFRVPTQFNIQLSNSTSVHKDEVQSHIHFLQIIQQAISC